MKLVRVAFLVPTSEAEIARAWLVEHAPAGFEERVDGERTELAVYVAPDAAGPITAAFPLAIGSVALDPTIDPVSILRWVALVPLAGVALVASGLVEETRGGRGG